MIKKSEKKDFFFKLVKFFQLCIFYSQKKLNLHPEYEYVLNVILTYNMLEIEICHFSFLSLFCGLD